MDVIPFAVRIRLIVALVISFFTYYDFIYFALDFYSLSKLTVDFNVLLYSIITHQLGLSRVLEKVTA
jgi:hypothetical protein